MQPKAREIYEKVYATAVQPPLYSAPWWLNATCGADGWDILFFNVREENGQAFLPFQKTVIRGMNAMINPPLTQWLPLIKTSQLHNLIPENKLEELKDFSILDIAVKPMDGKLLSSGELPINLKYSYLISSQTDINEIRGKYNEGLRRNLKEAAENYSIETSNDIGTFLTLCHSTYRQRGIKTPWWVNDKVPVIWNALLAEQQGVIELATKDGVPVAGILTAWDDTTCYYLIGGRMTNERGASGHALLLDNAIGRASDKGIAFDFEGSMNPGIANFFQSFGATPEPYWQIRKYRGLGKLWALLNKN
jgi:hypothetical protein